MSAVFGAFGKIPSLGDFMRHNLTAGFVQAWDTWMQEGMLAVREMLGESWDDAYLSAPIWRFTLPGGLAGSDGMLGIFMASVDRVGRQYPLTLAAPVDAQDPGRTHCANTSLFERLERIALAMLEDGSSRESLTDALESLQTMPAQSPVALPYAGAVPPEHIWAGEALSAQAGTAAIWSTALDRDHRMMTTRALPHGAEMRALFDLSPAAWGHQKSAEYS